MLDKEIHSAIQSTVDNSTLNTVEKTISILSIVIDILKKFL